MHLAWALCHSLGNFPVGSLDITHVLEVGVVHTVGIYTDYTAGPLTDDEVLTRMENGTGDIVVVAPAGVHLPCLRVWRRGGTRVKQLTTAEHNHQMMSAIAAW